MNKQTAELTIAVIDKARRVREMFEAQAPNELLVAHDELAAALDEYDSSIGYKASGFPSGIFTCPLCGSHCWGTSDALSPNAVGHCHGVGCKFSWFRKDDYKKMIFSGD